MVRIEQNVALAHGTSCGSLPGSCSAAAYRELLSNNGLGGDRAIGCFGGVRHNGRKKALASLHKGRSRQSKPGLTDTGIENAPGRKSTPPAGQNCQCADVSSMPQRIAQDLIVTGGGLRASAGCL